MWKKYECYKYGLSETVVMLLQHLGAWNEKSYLDDLSFHCHVNVTADWLSEWLDTTLSFDELLEELCTYHISKSAENSVVDFSLYPFLDDCTLGTYELYFYHPDFAIVQNINTWMSIRTLQSLL